MTDPVHTTYTGQAPKPEPVRFEVRQERRGMRAVWLVWDNDTRRSASRPFHNRTAAAGMADRWNERLGDDA